MEPNSSTPQPTSAAGLVGRLLEDREALDGAADLLRPVADAARGRGLWRRLVTGELMGHAAHPFLTDLPLGFFSSAALLDLVGGPGTEVAARRLVGAGIASAPAAALTGLAEYASLSQRPRRVAATHAVLNVASLGFFAGSWAVRPQRHRAGVALGLAGLPVTGLPASLGAPLPMGERAGPASTPAGTAEGSDSP